jgi:hypothetical protein
VLFVVFIYVPAASACAKKDELGLKPSWFYVAVYMGGQPGSRLRAAINLNDGGKQNNSFEISSRTK